MRPPDPPLLVDQEVRPVGIEAVFVEDSVGPRNVPPEVTQQVGFHLQFVLELPQRRRSIHRYWENLDPLPRELVEVLGKACELFATGPCKREREEGQQNVLLSAKGRKHNLLSGR